MFGSQDKNNRVPRPASRVPASQTVALATLGCKTNQFESAAMQEQLTRAGYGVVPLDAGADLVIVNTCTVTAATDAQSRKLVRRARRSNPDCRIIVTGCYAQVDPAALAELPGVSWVIGNQEKARLLDYLDAAAPQDRVAVGDIRQADDVCLPALTSFAGRSRAFVQIQNGCDAFCSYCIIPYARGASRSAAPADIVDRVRSLVDAGYPEVVLTGIHIGGYGRDLDPPLDLDALLRRLLTETGVNRLRLGSIEPTEIPTSLLQLIATSEVICPHLHIPLQSGDDSVLKRMGRIYGREEFRALIDRVRERLPDAGIGLDVIAGFPGETDAEFTNTFRLIEELQVNFLHVFPYSRRPGTPAAELPDQVPGHVIRERAEQLRCLGEEKRREFGCTMVGRTLQVVVEGERKGALLKGVAGNYLDVWFEGPDDLLGRCVEVRITGLVGDRLHGECPNLRVDRAKGKNEPQHKKSLHSTDRP